MHGADRAVVGYAYQRGGRSLLCTRNGQRRESGLRWGADLSADHELLFGFNAFLLRVCSVEDCWVWAKVKDKANRDSTFFSPSYRAHTKERSLADKLATGGAIKSTMGWLQNIAQVRTENDQ